jgi:hypothetical protein
METNLEVNEVFLHNNLEFYPQKILNWLRTYNILFRVNRKIKEYKGITTYENGLPIIRKREYFTMTIENHGGDIEFDNVNHCIFTMFLMWNGKNFENLKLIQK